MVVFVGFQTARADDWPQWRGVNRDAKSAETGLLKEWPEGGPAVVWAIEDAGVGYSAVSVVDGKIFTMGDLNGVEHILAFDEKTGKRLWAVQPEPVAAKIDAEVAGQFAKMDTNQDGVVDEFEILEKGNYQVVNFESAESTVDVASAAAKRSAAFIAHYDKDGDGALDVSEIPSGLGRSMRTIDRPSGGRKEAGSIAEARVAAVVAKLDTDKSGALERKEYQSTILRSEANNIDQPAEAGGKRGDEILTAEELKNHFARKETGFDGKISTEELTNYFEKNHPGRDGRLTPADVKGSMGGFRNDQGDGPRGTPTVVGDRLYTEGGNGDVACLDATTGKTVWYKSLVDDFGGKRPGWGYSESPLVNGDLVFVTPGGSSGTLVALNKDSGATVWTSTAVTQGAHYASPVLATIQGRKQVVQFGRESMFGVAEDGGTQMWSYKNAANGTANCATAVIDGNYVLASSAYGIGGGLAEISVEGGGQQSKEVWFEKKLANHHGGLVKVGDHVYGFGTGGLICIHFLTGEIKWTDPSVKKGSLIYADGMLYCLGEAHEVALVEANPTAYVERGRFKIKPQGRPSWAHPVVANGRFYIRDQHTLTAYDVKAK